MAMKSVPSLFINRSVYYCRLMETGAKKSMNMRYLSDDKGRMFSEEERAKETVYIQKMERERMEKLRMKKEAEQLKSPAAKDTNKSDKTVDEAHTT